MKKFNYNSYRQILQSFLSEGYNIIPLVEEVTCNQKTAYLRHDIDYHLKYAVEFAKVNHSVGVAGCFFVPVSSPITNLREERNQYYLKQIMDLDQKIGLHFYLPESLKDNTLIKYETVRQLIEDEYELLNILVPSGVVPAMSWHNPGLLGASYTDWIQGELPGILNAYSLAKKNVAYYADSNFRYSVEQWLSFASKGEQNIQLLFHPFQWSQDTNSMNDVLKAMFKDYIQEYDSLLKLNDVYSKGLPDGLDQKDIEKLFRNLS